MNANYSKLVENETMDSERALYHLMDANVKACTFKGPADGESVLKEAKRICVEDTEFSLRYPMWHVDDFELYNSSMDELTRAALWYDRHGIIENSKLHGIKALRECDDVTLTNCDIISQEFGWKSKNISLINSSITSEYLFLDCENIKLDNVNMKGKYSFQYIKNLVIENSNLDTKDAFWHSTNVTVRNSTVKGEYLAWFSDGLTLENCTIIGTQPLCYCKNLKLINCRMEDTDLSFEYSDVDAEIIGHVDSVKNPGSGKIVLDSVGEVIMEDAVMECTGEVIIRN